MSAVYFLRQSGLNPVKIGFTKYKNPKNRVNSYKTYFPNGLDFIGYVILEDDEEGKNFERLTHNYFNFFKINKEWFNIDEKQIIEFLNKFNKTLEKDFNSNYKYKIRENKIIELNKTLTAKEIAKQENISIQYVYRILKIKNIKLINQEKNKNELLNLFKNMSVKEIAKKQNVSVQSIYKKIKHFKIV